MKLIILVSTVFLSGCNWLCPRDQNIVDHNVVVTVPCKINAPQKPVMPLTESGKVEDDIFMKSKKALAEIELRKGYESQLESAIGSCQ